MLLSKMMLKDCLQMMPRMYLSKWVLTKSNSFNIEMLGVLLVFQDKKFLENKELVLDQK